MHFGGAGNKRCTLAGCRCSPSGKYLYRGRGIRYFRGREVVAAQLDQKTKVAKAMYEHIQLCADPQTEFVLARQSLGVSRVNHILRVHGHRIIVRGQEANSFDKLGKDALERLSPR